GVKEILPNNRKRTFPFEKSVRRIVVLLGRRTREAAHHSWRFWSPNSVARPLNRPQPYPLVEFVVVDAMEGYRPIDPTTDVGVFTLCSEIMDFLNPFVSRGRDRG